ncbi:hypothetical protein BOX15_Mlig003546g3 [Macrostomum lignano]|uniref:Sestrin n=1 Tax=Macrostomum lignano TaxID=282301 RepID=A0A267DRU5_9PLAT|nr:hypothetical protein BOX15_Mlig003546g3 [Macrostomum lignano]
MTANGTASEPFLPVGRSPESISMLRGLSDRESNNRSDIFSQCRSMFQVWYFGLSSPPNLSDMQYLGGAAAAGRAGDPSQRCNIEEQLPDLLRISKAAPLPDAREKAAELLDFVETNLHMRLPRPRYAADFAASEFIPQRELIPLDETLSNGEASASASRATFSNHFDYEDDELAETGSSSHDLDAELIERSQDLLLDQFHEWHRSCNMFHVMAYHPEYLDIFLRFHNCLLRSAGPVGYAERHYLALMAASRHRCAYLAHLHAAEFIHLNGDESWLRGLEHASPKMQKLGQLCRLVAHRPWEITSDILRPLLTGADSLSQSELVHCMCILAHFTALAGFVAGTGVRPEIDSPLGHTYRSQSGESLYQQQQQQQQQNFLQSSCNSTSGNLTTGHLPSSTSPTPSSPGIDPNQRVLDLMNAIKDIDDETEGGEALPEEQLIRRFECIEAETAGLPCFHRSVSREQQQQQQQQQMLLRQQQQQQLNSQELIAAELANFCQEPGYAYKDFLLAKADNKQLRSFRIQDYSWEEDGCCLVDRYLPSIGYELNERFETSFNLTYLTMGMNTNVETAPFRRAVWYYVHSIFGIRHDDYDYHLINRMLSIELKKYCKLVACAPEQVTMGHYRSAMPGFKHSEKVHVNLVIMDARVQACLLYSLRALNDHTTGQ